jgi:uncharacterized protein (TIGR02001 family)
MNKPLNLLCKTAVTSTLLVALPIQAEGDKPFAFSGWAMLMSDFVDRGLSFTNKDPAMAVAFEIAHESGFDLGAMAFNVNFLEGETVRPGDRANIVLSPYVGYRGNLSNNLSVDLQVYDYRTTGAASDLNYDYMEFTGIFTYSIQDTNLGFVYDFSPEFSFKTGQAHNFEFTVSHSLSNNLSFGGYVGWQGIEENEVMGADDYFHYSVWASYPIADFDVAIYYANTDLDNAEAWNADNLVFFTLSKFF